ncbi:MAG TPA: heavy metal-associated domain-containing protein [Polyangiaceae bacterium]|jgi:copper chaperone|nr:heavy metal-associated domain-containing protein [Polyangiaceae bacterium]
MTTNRETLLDVAGMSCHSCVRHINEALDELPGVSKVEVRLDDGKVLVQHDPGAAPADRLIEALRDAGYESSLSAAA